MSLSVAAIKALLDQQTDEIFLTTLEISHPAWGNPVRIVNNTEPIVRNGQTYEPLAFRPQLPLDSDGENPDINLIIDGVDRQMIQALRSIPSEQPQIRMEVIRASAPDLVEIGPFDFRIIGATYTQQTVSVQLSYETDYLDEPFTKSRFTPQTARGLFA